MAGYVKVKLFMTFVKEQLESGRPFRRQGAGWDQWMENYQEKASEVRDSGQIGF